MQNQLERKKQRSAGYSGFAYLGLILSISVNTKSAELKATPENFQVRHPPKKRERNMDGFC